MESLKKCGLLLLSLMSTCGLHQYIRIIQISYLLFQTVTLVLSCSTPHIIIPLKKTGKDSSEEVVWLQEHEELFCVVSYLNSPMFFSIERSKIPNDIWSILEINAFSVSDFSNRKGKYCISINIFWGKIEMSLYYIN